MSGRGDKKKDGSRRGSNQQTGQGKGQAQKANKEIKQEPRPGRTSNQGRKESSGGDITQGPDRGT